MHCHCGTNNRAPRWTFTDPCKAEVRPGAREESAIYKIRLLSKSENFRFGVFLFIIVLFQFFWSQLIDLSNSYRCDTIHTYSMSICKFYTLYNIKFTNFFYPNWAKYGVSFFIPTIYGVKLF